MPTADGAVSTRKHAGLSRRGLLAGAVATGAAVSLPLTAAPADAAGANYLPRTRAYRRTPLPDAATRHMANRFGYGYTPAMRLEIQETGGPQAWFDAQLTPENIPDDSAESFAGWFATRDRTAAEHFDIAEQSTGYAYEVAINHARWSMLRRAFSHRQVHEVMTEFWCNHLHVYGVADLTWLWRQDYDAVIRTHALGRFDEMLQAAVVHPTMLTYLDADLSQIQRRVTSNGRVVETERINENLGRELLELHTVGRGAGYSETEVRDSAYILTGWTVDRHGTWECSYDPDTHYIKPVQVLGFSAANASLDGRQVLRDYLQYLAHHPATAQRIARKLAVRFVSDTPSDDLVATLATVFRDSGTDIKATLRALVAHPEFAASAGAKVRTPTEDVAATLRVLGVEITKPTSSTDAANVVYWMCKSIGQVPFGWERPDGFPDVGSAWSSAARMMGSFRIHYSLAGGWMIRSGGTTRAKESWLPQDQIRFDQLVDHLCRSLHGRRSGRLLLGAACIAVDVSPSEVITRDHALIKWRMPKLIGLLLDTPQHLTK